ncbi:MAG TPA: hypothetical protein VI583_07875, partial [Cyclobacteriaceae bacterium]|nr:hypothetical protein [Cyclobacteriaceae bacterium]
MKFLNPLFLTLAVISGFSHGANAQPAFSDESQAFKYDIYREIWFDSQVARSADSLHIYFRLDFIKASHAENEPELYYELRDGYEDKSPGDAYPVNTEKNCLYHSLNTYIYYASVPRSQPERLLVFHVMDKEAGYHYQYDVPLTGENQIPYSNVLLYSAEIDAPLVRFFIHEGDSLYLHSWDQGTERAFVYCYRTAFDAADPPMRLIDRSVNKNLDYDTLFTLDIHKPFTLPGKGLYFIQSDTAAIEGITVLCENIHFPKLAT